MHRYRNKKTGAVVKVHGDVSGNNWEPVDNTLYSPGPVRDPYEEVFPEKSEETAPKPKTSRKGRK